MKITIYRGSKEIGGNCILVEYGIHRLLLDMGLPLIKDEAGNYLSPNSISSKTIQQLLNEGILPNADGLYTPQDKSRCDAILISHAHLDHYGLIDFAAKDIPLYMSKGTAALIKTNELLNPNWKAPAYTGFESGKPFDIGPFLITPFLMDHSAFDAYGFSISCDQRTIIYSGDFRSHGRKKRAYEYFLKKAPRNASCLLLEGTMLERVRQTKIQTEEELELEVAAFKDKGIILFNCSTQNIDRLVSLYKASLRLKRTFVIDFYTAHILKQANGISGGIPYPCAKWRTMKVFYPHYLSKRIADSGRQDVLYQFAGNKITRDEISNGGGKIMMMVRPSMKLDLRKISCLEGGLYIYSQWGGYLEDAKNKQFVDYLVEKRKMTMKHIHTSGHADIATLKEVVETLKPLKIVPIHTQSPQKALGLFENVQLAKDGVPIEVLARFDSEGRPAGGVYTMDGVTIKTAGDITISRDVIKWVSKKIERAKQLEKESCPEIGIFWYGKNKANKLELVSFGTPYKIGQGDEDFINYRLGHDKEWQHAKQSLSDNYVEYYDPPRGRVLFRKSDGRFVVYLTRSIMTPNIKAIVRDKFKLPEDTLFCTDEHYG